jgi:NDP-sugar pyrophosphorylase family protein
MIEQHNASNASASIAGYAVDDPARYGLLDVIGGWVTGFREKPDAVSPEDKYLINAGVYILGNRFYDNHLPEGKSSIEREGFPAAIAGADPPHCYEHGGYWIDIGTFESYFEANFSLLNRYYMEGADWLWGERNDTAVFKDQIYLNKSCRLGKHVDLFHRVIMMSETRVGDRCRLQNTITMGNCCIGDNCRLENCIIGPSARVAAGSELANTVVVADEEDTPFYPGSHEIAP